MLDNLVGTEIAIIGMAGRYPRSRNLDEFWEHLRSGDELISFFTAEDLAVGGIAAAQINNPHFVRAAGVLEDTELFDATFFGVLPREAELMDPQQRLFLEVAWEALEHAGYAPDRYDGLVGVYAGAVENTYLLFNLMTHPDVVSMGLLPVMVVNGRDYLPTRVSYKLNLRGPSCLVQSACSTSLVAIHTACQSLLNRECDMAIAGGVSVLVNQRMGYLYTEGGILSPDGHCRTFDASAQGTIFGSGIGLVVLKPLENALLDGDSIHGVILGSAVNNDGSLKVSYTAPSVSGQAEVIIEALANAGIGADTISYIEAHGTATAMGDTIEVQALAQAFQKTTDKHGFCAIGAVKTNLGHLDAAAGVTGVLKTLLALKHRQIPPSLHFEQPNPKIDFASSPFYVNARLSDWPVGPSPRRAGVNSFGIGGTNAHVILQETPDLPPSDPARPWQVLVLSARTATALETMTANLLAHLHTCTVDLADIAYTLQLGRTCFAHRRVVVCRDRDDAITALERRAPGQVLTQLQEQQDRGVAFLFPGQGAQYPQMGRGVYQREPLFRQIVDDCAALLLPHIGVDIRSVIFDQPATNDQRPMGDQHALPAMDGDRFTTETPEKKEYGVELARSAADSIVNRQSKIVNSAPLDETWLTQPTLFVIEYALARLWQSWGVAPRAMVGHSVGEYVAACLADVLSLDDALRLIALRDRLIQRLPGGAMLSVALPEAEVRALLPADLSLAAVNAPRLCVVAGAYGVVDAFQEHLESYGIQTRRLHTSHAFHSAALEPMLVPFAAAVSAVRLNPPAIPFLSNVTGRWITAEQATDPAYWVRHVRETVRFADCLETLLADANPVLLEVGPGRMLSTFARQRSHKHGPASEAIPSLRHPSDSIADEVFLLTALGRLWLSGATIDWGGLHARERRRRVPLPTYPFERQRFWIDPYVQPTGVPTAATLGKRANVADWFYAPYWKPSLAPAARLAPTTWVVMGRHDGPGEHLVARLRAAGQMVQSFSAGETAIEAGTLDPRQSGDYLAALSTPDIPQHVLYCVDQDFDIYGLIALMQALDHLKVQQLRLTILTQGAQQVHGHDQIDPAQALVLGPALVLPQEHPGLGCRVIDVIIPQQAWQAGRLYDDLLVDLLAAAPERLLAYRDGQRWVQSFDLLALPSAPDAAAAPPALRQGGSYLITGGLGRIGRTLAHHLAEAVGARLTLVGRTALPLRDAWDTWLASHDTADPLSTRIACVRALEASGAEVLALAADVADHAQMAAVLAQAEQRFGALHGVIHAAGIVEEQKAFIPLHDLTRAACDEQFRPKVAGGRVLAELLHDRSLDFCLLFSSTATVLGGLGFSAYAAANAFLDALAQQQRHIQPTPWLCIDWDGWLFADFAQRAGVGSSAVEQAMLPEEGVRAFGYALGLTSLARVVVATGDLQTRLAHWVRPQVTESSARPPSSLTSRYARPTLPNDYVEPRNDIEVTLAEIWQHLLGLDAVGVHDNFFDLGGHSLLATQLMSRVRDAFAIDLSIRQFFEVPTIAHLTLEVLRAQVGGALDEQSLGALLTRVEQVDEEGLARLLDGYQD